MRLISIQSLGITVVLSGFFLASSCATAPTPAPVPANAAAANAGKLVPDSPGDSPSDHEIKADTAAASKKAGATKKDGSTEFKTGDFVTNDFVHVRKGPGMKFEVVRTLSKGAKVSVSTYENKIWAKIADGEFVSQRFLSDK